MKKNDNENKNILSRKTIIRTLACANAVAVFSQAAKAHPIEGTSTGSVLFHLLTQPDHLAVLGVSFAVAAALLYTSTRVSRGITTLRALTAMCVLFAFAFIASG